MQFNWRKFKILIEGSFAEKEVQISFTDKKRKTNEHIEKVINEVWSDTKKGRMSVNLELWDSIVYNLHSAGVKEAKLTLEIGETTYKELQGTNATNWILGDIYGKEYLANGLLVQILLFTKSGELVLGSRNTGVKEGLETLAIFGGTIDKDEIVLTDSSDLFQAAKKELFEEVGIEDGDLEDFKLTALIEDWKHYPVLYFHASSNLRKDEILKKFETKATDEHTGLSVLSTDEVKKRVEDEPERFSDLTLVGVKFLKK